MFEFDTRGIRSDASKSYRMRFRPTLALLVEAGEAGRGLEQRRFFDVGRGNGLLVPSRFGRQVGVTARLGERLAVMAMRYQADEDQRGELQRGKGSSVESKDAHRSWRLTQVCLPWQTGPP